MNDKVNLSKPVVAPNPPQKRCRAPTAATVLSYAPQHSAIRDCCQQQQQQPAATSTAAAFAPDSRTGSFPASDHRRPHQWLMGHHFLPPVGPNRTTRWGGGKGVMIGIGQCRCRPADQPGPTQRASPAAPSDSGSGSGWQRVMMLSATWLTSERIQWAGQIKTIQPMS